ncbi:MAG TPA: LacI family DNA-binding transcriptional regulator [Capsulimonadaceae bacterium]|jgi:DNA-binding LacI/PurR family transcriptional regulator
MSSVTVPLYKRIVEDIVERIDREEFAYGSQLPSRAEMATRYGVSHITVQAALKDLAHLGYVEGRRGAGVYVIHGAHPQPRPQIASSTIVIIGVRQPYNRAPHKDGWAKNVAAGAFEATLQYGFNQTILHPDRLCQESMESLILNRPVGVVIPEGLPGPAVHYWASYLRNAGVPCVVYGDSPDLATFDRVTSDWRHGGRSLAEWLIAQGRRNIIQARPATVEGYWFGPLREGYVSAMLEAGLQPNEVVRFEEAEAWDPTQDGFERRVRRASSCLPEYLSCSVPVDAIMTASDGHVPVFASACRLFGKVPGDDVLVTGYDDYWANLPELEYEPAPPAASVDKHNFEIGERMVKLLLDRTEGKLAASAERIVVLPTVTTYK